MATILERGSECPEPGNGPSTTEEYLVYTMSCLGLVILSFVLAITIDKLNRSSNMNTFIRILFYSAIGSTYLNMWSANAMFVGWMWADDDIMYYAWFPLAVGYHVLFLSVLLTLIFRLCSFELSFEIPKIARTLFTVVFCSTVTIIVGARMISLLSYPNPKEPVPMPSVITAVYYLLAAFAIGTFGQNLVNLDFNVITVRNIHFLCDVAFLWVLHFDGAHCPDCNCPSPTHVPMFAGFGTCYVMNSIMFQTEPFFLD